MTEGELKKRIREKAEDWEDTPWQTLKEEVGDVLADINARIDLNDLFELLDEALAEFPKQIKFKDYKTKAEFYGANIQFYLDARKWRRKWLGAGSVEK